MYSVEGEMFKSLAIMCKEYGFSAAVRKMAAALKVGESFDYAGCFAPMLIKREA